jgi:hypothetical protein
MLKARRSLPRGQVKELLERFFDMPSLGVRKIAIVRVLSLVFLSLLFVGSHGVAQAATLQWPGDIRQEINRRRIDELSVGPYVAKFLPNLLTDGIRERVKVLVPVTLSRPLVVDERAEQKTDCSRNESGARLREPNSEYIKHHWLTIILRISLAFFIGSLCVIALNCYWYGINDTWRTLLSIVEDCSGIPIPQWMRFIPKDEMDAHP